MNFYCHRRLVIIFFGVLGLFIFSVVADGHNDSVVLKLLDSEENSTIIKDYLNPGTIEKYELEENNSTLDNNFLQQNVSETENINQRLYFPYNLKIISEVLKNLENEECVKDTVIVLEAMTKHEKWALELFDSFPKFPTGILYGNYYQLGNFDECVGAKQESKHGKVVQGQYCLTDIHFKSKNSYHGRQYRSADTSNLMKPRHVFNNSIIHWGICLPSSCTTKDAQIFTREVFSSAAETFEVISVSVEERQCYQDTSQSFSTLEIVYGCTVGFFFIFSLLATGLHLWYLKKMKSSVVYNIDTVRAKNPSTGKELLQCFSIIHTTRKFFQTKPNEYNLECICGIKFLSMCMIIVGHCIFFTVGGPIENKRFLDKEYTNILNAPFINNTLFVDTFLLVSGFLMCRLLLIELDKRKGKFNILIIYLVRYIRLTPAYIVVIGFHATWLYRLGTGPFWETRVGSEKNKCLEVWWTNILYINNYIHNDKLCMFQSWYLAVDYHLFIVAPFIVYPLWKWSRIGKAILFLCGVLSVMVPFWITFKNNLDPTQMAYGPEISDIYTNFYFINVYLKTHMRASSYIIGLFFGYFIHRLQSAGTKIPSYIIYLGWISSTSFALLSMNSIIIFYKPERLYNNLETAIYASLHRVAWCLAVGWVLVVCITENAGIINKFLSWKPFIPLSRLTYCAYLANSIVEISSGGILRQPTYLNKYELFSKVNAHLCTTFLMAFCLCILFESPIHGIEKILMTRQRSKEHKQNSTLRPIQDS